ncbi:MAG: dephospho-CoA kinase [Clostridia bacterium]|nr:dephospho-CoA kinase [Clostridia bacterium]
MGSMYILGLTGPSGAGKSLAATVFERQGFAVIDADAVAHGAAAPGSPCLAELAAAFGGEILREDGSLDRRRLARIAFSDAQRLERLNAITHPHIMRLIAHRLDALRADGANYVLLDAPALYQSGADALCDRVLAVTAPRGLCIRRVMERDGLSEEEAARRLRAVDEAYFTQKADYVLENSGDKGPYEAALEALALRIILQAAGNLKP